MQHIFIFKKYLKHTKDKRLENSERRKSTNSLGHLHSTTQSNKTTKTSKLLYLEKTYIRAGTLEIN